MREKLKKLEREGKIKKQKVGIIQVEELLQQAVLDLKEAEKICDMAERATYLLAYMAMLKAGRALLLLHGFLPDDGGQHKTVVDVTADILGVKYRDLTTHFEFMRRKRNQMTYEAGGLVSLLEAKAAFGDAKKLLKGILREVEAKNPQFRLKM